VPAGRQRDLGLDQAAEFDTPPGALAPRVAGLKALAARAGVEMDARLLSILSGAGEVEPAMLVRCAVDAKLSARALPMQWADLLSLARNGTPTLLMLEHGGAALLDGAAGDGSTVTLRDPARPGAEPARLDRNRLERFWLRSGVIIRGSTPGERADRPFDIAWLRESLGPDLGLMRDIALMSVVLAVLAIAPPLILMQITDRVLLYQSWSTLTLMSVLVALFVVFETALGWAQRHLSAVVARRTDGRISLFIMQRLLRLPLEFFERTPTGETQARLFQVYRVRDFMVGPLFRTLLDTVTVLAVLPVMFLIAPLLSVVVLGLAAAILLVVLANTPAMSRAIAAAVTADRAKGTTLIETIQGIRTVKALAIEPQQGEAWNRNVAASLQAHFRLQSTINRMQTMVGPFERLMYMGIMFLGTWLLLTESVTMTTGGLFAFLMLSQRVAAPLVSVAQLTQSLGEVRTAFSEASAVLNHPPERPSSVLGVRPRIVGHIGFQDVTFAYPGSVTPALSEVSFDLPAGQVLGLVGRSGSGKSTVTRLLQGLNAGYAGLVKLDGVEMRELDLQHLRGHLGVVLQDNFLFRGTIRENIIAGRPGISFEKVILACRIAGAEEFVDRMPRGYETFIEEGSPNLSGGQRQRLAIARAVVTDPAILILDEATSALDPESEAIVNANLRRLAHGRTVVIVSHRLSSLVEADKIIVLDKGRVDAEGTHGSLLADSAIYRHLWMQQNREAGRTA